MDNVSSSVAGFLTKNFLESQVNAVTSELGLDGVMGKQNENKGDTPVDQWQREQDHKQLSAAQSERKRQLKDRQTNRKKDLEDRKAAIKARYGLGPDNKPLPNAQQPELSKDANCALM
eukprot:TRINITY_DN4461_c0_g1_i1.p1 TRINITY_DN4461_c0_g1~~TRINITY_DN4461_c0_g1_i1.p1  ORF type:complete len:129 (+),score=39.43 TRINITY_DN4461_c0_g1_i1:35-388(+)